MVEYLHLRQMKRYTSETLEWDLRNELHMWEGLPRKEAAVDPYYCGSGCFLFVLIQHLQPSDDQSLLPAKKKEGHNDKARNPDLFLTHNTIKTSDHYPEK